MSKRIKILKVKTTMAKKKKGGYIHLDLRSLIDTVTLVNETI